MNDLIDDGRRPDRLLAPCAIRRIYDASLLVDDPVGRLATFAAIAPWWVDRVAQAPIELIDRGRGLLRLADPNGVVVEVAVGFEAARAIDRARGDRREGPLLLDHHGSAMELDADTQDYAVELVGEIDADTLGFGWSFPLLRESVFAEMIDHGVPMHVATAHAGLGTAGVQGISHSEILVGQRAAADWWAWRLGIEPPSAFILLDAVLKRQPRWPSSFRAKDERREGGA
jgi:hypothetical protein